MNSGFIRRKVYQRNDGSSRVAYEATLPYHDATGKRRWRSKTCKTRREAQKQIKEWERDEEAGVLVERSSQTLAEFLVYWLENHIKPNKRPNTYEQYRGHVHNHIINAIGTVRLQDVSAATVQKMVDKLRKEGTGQATIRCCFDRLSQALRLAVRLGLIPRNPAEMVERPTLPHTERQTWTVRELSLFLEQARDSSYGPIWMLIAVTGIRRGEAMGLRWKDIDFEKGVMHIRQAVVMVHGSPVIGPTKSRAGKRTIPLSEEMLHALNDHRHEQVQRQVGIGDEWSDFGLVFPSNVGTPLNARNLDRQYRSLISRAGVPFIPIHGLRHTFATLMIAEGEDIRTLSDILGHSRTSVTTDIYGHVTPHRKVELIQTASTLILKGQDDHESR